MRCCHLQQCHAQHQDSPDHACLAACQARSRPAWPRCCGSAAASKCLAVLCHSSACRQPLVCPAACLGASADRLGCSSLTADRHRLPDWLLAWCCLPHSKGKLACLASCGNVSMAICRNACPVLSVVVCGQSRAAVLDQCLQFRKHCSEILAPQAIKLVGQSAKGGFVVIPGVL